jgi:tetratricopeptide (TPR) repeat protein
MWDPSLPGQIAQSSLRFGTPQERRAFIAHASQGDQGLQAQALQFLVAYESGSFANPALSNPAHNNPALSNPALSNPALDNPALSNPALALPSRPLPAMPMAQGAYPSATLAKPKGSSKKTLMIVGGVVGGVALLVLLIASPFVYSAYRAWSIESTKKSAEESRKYGKFEESAKGYERLLAMYKSKYGDDDVKTIEAMVKLGDAYIWAGKRDQAIVTLTEAAQKQEKKFGPSSRERISTLTILAGVLRRQNKVEEELGLWESIIKVMKDSPGGNDAGAAQCINQFIEACIASNQRSRSIAAQEELLDFFRQNAGVHSPQTQDFAARLVFAYAECGKPEKAIALGEANIATVKQLFGDNSRQSLVILECLAKACDAIQRRDDALRWRQQHEEAKRSTPRNDSEMRIFSGSY